MRSESLPSKTVVHLVEPIIRLQPCLIFQPICNASTASLPYMDPALAADRVETD